MRVALDASGYTSEGDRAAILSGKLHGIFSLPVIIRAAIQAMREPTHEMCRAGERQAFNSAGPDVHSGEAGDIWRDMLDAALSTPPIDKDTKS